MYRSDTTQDPIRIAIVGAGIVGLIFAVTVNTLDTEHKFSIELYESSSELSQIGAGINIWPRSMHIFQEIGPGLGEALKPYFDRCPDFEPSKSRGSIATSYQMLTRARLLSMGRVGFRSEESRPKEWFQGH